MTETKMGRPKGARNKSLVVRTEALRGSISEDECKALGRELFNMAMSDSASYGDKVKAMTLLLKYVALSADVEIIAEKDSAAPSTESMAKAAMLIEALSSK